MLFFLKIGFQRMSPNKNKLRNILDNNKAVKHVIGQNCTVVTRSPKPATSAGYLATW